jgi:hypothetical protein
MSESGDEAADERLWPWRWGWRFAAGPLGGIAAVHGEARVLGRELDVSDR